jgi:cation/acetate symporter
MLSGISVTLIYVFQHKGIMFIPGTSFLGNLPPNWFCGIEPNAFGVVGAMVNFTVTLTVTRFTPAPPDEVRLLVERVRLPVS